MPTTTHTHLSLNHTFGVFFPGLAKCIDKQVHTQAHTHIDRSVKLGQQWRVGFNAEHIRSLKLICIFMWVAIKMTHTQVGIHRYMHMHT